LKGLNSLDPVLHSQLLFTNCLVPPCLWHRHPTTSSARSSSACKHARSTPWWPSSLLQAACMRASPPAPASAAAAMATSWKVRKAVRLKSRV